MGKETWMLEDTVKGKTLSVNKLEAEMQRDAILFSIAVSLKRIAEGIEALGMTIAVK